MEKRLARCALIPVLLLTAGSPAAADETMAIHEIIERTVREIEEMNRQIEAARQESAQSEAPTKTSPATQRESPEEASPGVQSAEPDLEEDRREPDVRKRRGSASSRRR